MEDDNCLDLSLGPPSTGKTTATTTTGKSGGVDDRDTKLINEFKHFLDGGTMQIGPGMPSSQMKPENFYGNNSSTPVDLETSKEFIVREKRKNVFGETSQKIKHEKKTDQFDLQDKSRASHISINTDDDSTAENEDIADSEADGSTSNLSDFKIENVSQSVQFPNQPVNIMNMNQLNSVGMNIRPSYPLRGMTQVGATTGNERTTSQPVLSPNLPVLVGYNPAPLPKSDKENSRVGRGQLNSDKYNDGTPPNSSEFRHDSKAVEGSRVTTDQGREDGVPSEFPTIKPGIAADVEFGGCGSYPNLPWVSTSGTGPNGRTISGVTYRYNPTQIRIVCACHGMHLSPEEFVQHASEEQGNVPSSNPDALARN